MSKDRHIIRAINQKIGLKERQYRLLNCVSLLIFRSFDFAALLIFRSFDFVAILIFVALLICRSSYLLRLEPKLTRIPSSLFRYLYSSSIPVPTLVKFLVDVLVQIKSHLTYGVCLMSLFKRNLRNYLLD